MADISRILIVGSDHIWSIERFYLKYLKELGVDVELFGVQNKFYAYYNSGLANKVMVRMGVSTIFRRLSNLLLQKVKAFQPKIIWVFKGMEILPSMLLFLKSEGYCIVNYNPDNPLIFSSRGSGNENLRKSISLYHLYLTYDRQIAQQLVEQFTIKTGILPFGFDLPETVFEKSKSVEERLKVCFLGNPDKFRASFLLQLANHVPIDVYGNDWEKFLQHENINVFKPVYGEDFWLSLRSYRVQLNMMRPHNPGSHNMRTFEVPGIGGIGLFPFTQDHSTYFDEGKEIFLYKNIDDCIAAATELLAIDKSRATEIRNNARSRSIHSGYTYKDRTEQALRMLEEL